MKYTQIPSTTFQQLQMNAGILVDEFDPATGEIGNIIGATTGGIQFHDTVNYTDLGEDVDNCPKNTMELKILDSHEVTIGGTFVTVSAGLAKILAGAANLEGNKITPRNDILQTDYEDLWWIGDYSNVNTGENAGFLAIHLMNALNTNGFQIQSADKSKGQFAFTYTGHYSMNAQDVVPYEIYVKSSSEQPQPSVNLNKHSVTLKEGDTTTLTVVTVPAGQTVTWSSGDSTVATISNGTITAESAGNTIITASITVDGVTYNDTCTVVVTEV